jgi:hypothetical protein
MHAYFDYLMRAILHFQFIEEALKQYLTVAYQIVEFQTRGVLPVRLQVATASDGCVKDLLARAQRLSEVLGRLRDAPPA